MEKQGNLYRRNVYRHQIYKIRHDQSKGIFSDKAETDITNAKLGLDSLEDKVFIYGFGSSDAVSMDNVTANGGLAFGANLHPWDRLFLSVGIGGNIVKKEKKDSVNINSIFFPDNASSVVYVHYELSITNAITMWKYKYKDKKPSVGDNLNDDLLFFTEASLQNRNIEGNDSLIHNFGIYNISAGLKYRWSYLKDEKNKFCFDVAAGFGYLEISKQSEKIFQAIVDPAPTTKANLPTIYRGINLAGTIQYNDLIVYVRLFNPISVNGALTYQHNIYFSTGVKVTGKFFSF